MLIAHPGIVHIVASRSVTLQPRLREARKISTVFDVEIVIYIVRVCINFTETSLPICKCEHF